MTKTFQEKFIHNKSMNVHFDICIGFCMNLYVCCNVRNLQPLPRMDIKIYATYQSLFFQFKKSIDHLMGGVELLQFEVLRATLARRLFVHSC